MKNKYKVKYFTFIFMNVLHEIPQEVFPNDLIIFRCYENDLPINLRYSLK